MQVVLTYGTFDLFHFGHVRLLKRLKSMGDYLIVGCSTDEFNAGKGKKTVVPFEHRVEVLEACRYVDKVIPENSWDQKRDDIRKHAVRIFAIGDDWAGHFDDLQDICDVVYLPRTDGISSTNIKGYLSATLSNELISIAHDISAIADRVVQVSNKSENKDD